MKLTKIILTGVFATAMMSTSFAAVETIQDTSRVEKVEKVEVVTEEGKTKEVNSQQVENKVEDGVVAEANTIQLTEIGNEAASRKEIKLTALPPAITSALKTEQYSDCKVERAYVIKEDGVKTYEIEVKRGENHESLFFNEDGVEIEK